MPGKAVIVATFPEPENDMELGAIIETLKTAFEDRDPQVKMYMGIRDVADRVIEVFAPLQDNEENNGSG